jgi:hypothetical protein
MPKPKTAYSFVENFWNFILNREKTAEEAEQGDRILKLKNRLLL